VNLKSAIHNPQSQIRGPLAFEPILIERIWGGRRMESEFHKRLPPQKCIGESWEVVDRPEAQSIVANGALRGATLHELWERQRQEIFGGISDAPRFPLLIKILDAQENLSLQVHPPEEIASKLGGEPKSEFWYVVQAHPEAKLFVGFREPMTQETFEARVRNGTIIDHIHRIDVQSGDAIFLPAGSVHAIGAGNLIIEIQQNSDTTYRVFDWNRIDPSTGKKRDLHIEQAIQSINFEEIQPKVIESESELLVSHSLFEIEKWSLAAAREAAPLGRFAIVCCLTGNLSCADARLAPGEFFLVPAHLKDRKLEPLAPDTSLLRVTIPV
jgi:mannose-6-phosphate isomerase